MNRTKWIILSVMLMIMLVAGFFVPHSVKGELQWWNVLPIFYSVFGFVGCFMLVFVAKMLGKLFVQQDESYYD